MPGKSQQDGPTLFDASEPQEAEPQRQAPKDTKANNRKPLLLVMDGHAMVYRAWFALANTRPFTVRKTGEDVRGVYSFTTTFFKTYNDLKPTHVAIAFDPPGRTFRDDLYDKYKANRPAMPDPLRQNIERARQVMQAFDVPIYEYPGFEADDVLGTLASQAQANSVDMVIATGDTDTLQLVSPHVRVLLTTGFADSKMYDVNAVAERYGGLTPDQVRDVKALTGDTSDNIPGVPGVGIKTAVKLVSEFGSVEGVLEHLNDVKPPRIQGLIREHGLQLQAGKILVTISREAPVTLDLEATDFGTFQRDDVLKVFQELEFSSLVDRIPRPNGDTPPAAAEAPTPTEPAAAPADSSLTIVDDQAKLDAMLSKLTKADVIFVEAHGSTTRAMEAELVGMGFALESGETWYVPTAHAEGKQLAVEDVAKQVIPLLQGEKPGIAGHNLNHTLTLLSNYGLVPTKTPVAFDTLIAAHLLGEKSFGLKQLAFNRLNSEIKSRDDLCGTGRKQVTLNQVTIEDAAAFVCANLEASVRFKQTFTPEMERDGLTRINRDYSMPLLPVLVQMQVNGIAIDPSVLAEMNEELTDTIQAEERAAYDDVGHEFTINSPSQLGELLFEELKLPVGRKTKTGYSTDASILENLREVHPVINHVLKYRELTKLKSTYVDTLPQEINPRTHRIHTTYNQAGSATGRLASNDPNLQNIPVRTEMGLRVRKAFVASKPEHILLSADYSQIDLRALAHLSHDPNLMEAFEKDLDIHASTASLIYNVPLNEVTPDMRRLAKVMNFGVAYGLSAFGISRQTEMSVDEGGQFIADYFGTYPKVREFLDDVVRKAKETGYTETLLGRRRYIPELKSPVYPVRQAGERIALNMPVQGTSADIINAAMVEVQKRLETDAFEAKMLLQVHDELVFELPRTEQKPLSDMLHEVMPNALKLDVPVKIDIKAGENWAEMTAQREAPVEFSAT